MGLFSSKTTIPASGYYAMPYAYRSLFENNLNAANKIFYNPDGSLNSSMFTPLGQTDAETKAYGMINQGLTPTPESLQNDINMLSNPYDSYVINGLNREAQGQNSLVNQAATQAGQIGSNRSFLGTSDVEQNRLNNIGQFKQSNYNNAINTSLGQLSSLRQQDISNLLGEGSQQRALDSATKQSPYTALQAAQNTLSDVPTSFGNFGSPQQTVSSGGGLGGLLGSIAPIVGNFIAPGIGGVVGGALGGLASGGGIAGALQGGFSGGLSGGLGSQLGFTGGIDPRTGINWNSGRIGNSFFSSDRRLKENIEYIGQENGYAVYEFSYKNDDKRYKGVMAQDILELKPEAVTEIDGFYAVNYEMLGLEMTEVNHG